MDDVSDLVFEVLCIYAFSEGFSELDQLVAPVLNFLRHFKSV